MKRLTIIVLIALFSFTGCKKTNDQFKVAFVYVGSVNDGGWTAAHDEGRLEIEKMFPDVQTSYVENVPEGAEAERIITTFAKKGFNVIFTASFGFMDPTINVAKKFPDTVFMHCSGYKRDKNVGTYFGRMYQAKYLAGIVAGKMTVTNKIGYIAPHPIPEVIRHINAFTLGARKVNPDATVRVIWTNSWFDMQKEKEAAYSLIEVGSDILASGCDSSAALVVAEEKGVKCIGYDSDARAVAKNTFLTAPMWNWISVYADIVGKAKNKEISDYTNIDYWNGLETNVIKIAPLSDLVSLDIKNIVKDTTQLIIEGKEKIFVGPLKKQDGSDFLLENEVADDGTLLSMMFFVDGVYGVIPLN